MTVNSIFSTNSDQKRNPWAAGDASLLVFSQQLTWVSAGSVDIEVNKWQKYSGVREKLLSTWTPPSASHHQSQVTWSGLFYFQNVYPHNVFVPQTVLILY